MRAFLATRAAAVSGRTCRLTNRSSYKEDIVRETLEHLTPVDAAVRKTLAGRVLGIIPSPQVFNYRNKLELSFGYGTMRHEDKPAPTPGAKGQRIYFDENPGLGFHRQASGRLFCRLPNVICTMNNCRRFWLM